MFLIDHACQPGEEGFSLEAPKVSCLSQFSTKLFAMFQKFPDANSEQACFTGIEEGECFLGPFTQSCSAQPSFVFL